MTPDSTANEMARRIRPSRYFEATNGYQLLWPILGVPILAVIPLVRHMAHAEASGTASRPAG